MTGFTFLNKKSNVRLINFPRDLLMVNYCENCHRRAVCLLKDLCTQIPWIFAPTQSARAGILLIDLESGTQNIGICSEGHNITLNDLVANKCVIALLGFEIEFSHNIPVE